MLCLEDHGSGFPTNRDAKSSDTPLSNTSSKSMQESKRAQKATNKIFPVNLALLWRKTVSNVELFPFRILSGGIAMDSNSTISSAEWSLKYFPFGG